MATIAENLQILKDSTDAIKLAIIDKGGNISGDISTWADAINNIGTTKDNVLRILSNNLNSSRIIIDLVSLSSSVYTTMLPFFDKPITSQVMIKFKSTLGSEGTYFLFNPGELYSTLPKYWPQEEGSFSCEPLSDDNYNYKVVIEIIFTIAGKQYRAEEGMTWEQWINSEYNTDKLYISNNIIRIDLKAKISEVLPENTINPGEYSITIE